MQDVIDELEGEAAAIRALGVDAPSVVRAVGPLLDRLAEDPRAVALLEGLYAEGRALVATLVAEENELVERARAIAKRIPREPFDTDTDHKPGTPPRTLTNIANLIEADTDIRDAIPAGDLEDPSKARELLLAVRVRIAHAPDEATKLALEPEVIALSEEHDRFWHRTSLALRSSAGIAALRFPHLLRQMAPSASVGTYEWAEEQRAIYVDADVVFALAHGQPVGGATFPPDPWPSHVMFFVRMLSADIANVLGEMRRRAKKGHSHIALLRRYKTRCEWYARDEMRALGEVADAAKRPEDRLVEHLAGFLFDHGLNPLNTPMTGPVRADLLDPTAPRFALYIEAKQHEDLKGAKKATRTGLRQIADTANMLESLRIHEAFLVVFRRRGELVSFVPDTLQVGHLRVHIVRVDIAPRDEVGSRERRNPKTVDPRRLIDMQDDDPELI
jgi:hypothetical protein